MNAERGTIRPVLLWPIDGAKSLRIFSDVYVEWPMATYYCFEEIFSQSDLIELFRESISDHLLLYLLLCIMSSRMGLEDLKVS